MRSNNSIINVRLYIVILILILLNDYLQHTSSLTFHSTKSTTTRKTCSNKSFNRKQLLQYLKTSVAITSCVIISSCYVNPINTANASNLPKDTGATFKNVGTIETLIPIVQIKRDLETAKLLIIQNNKNSTPNERDVSLTKVYKILSTTLPKNENNYKKLFDEYSNPISYKQKFLDQNAFLVYYTKGYDGPDRPNIESNDDSSNKQILQYGARNDSWVVIDELFSELNYYSKLQGVDTATAIGTDDLNELVVIFNRAILALDGYLSLAPISDLEEANKKIINNMEFK